MRIFQKILDLTPLIVRQRIKNIPVIKQLQELIMRYYINNKEVITTISAGPAKGLVFPVKFPQDKQIWIGTWELDFASTLKNKVNPGWICYDIGGYKGYYAGIMALKGAAKVIVFEPMPDNILKIKQLINLNPSLPIIIEEIAVSDTTGDAVFNIMEEETMGKLEKSSFQKNEKFQGKLIVKTHSLDDLISQGLPEPDLIKIDVEGAEEFVLLGAIEVLKRKKPVLMLEVHSEKIGKRCLDILKPIYKNITEVSGKSQLEKDQTEICHYLVEP